MTGIFKFFADLIRVFAGLAIGLLFGTQLFRFCLWLGEALR